jgi:hypothetical protein
VKSVVLYQVKRKTYYLSARYGIGFRVIWRNNNSQPTMKVDDSSDDSGFIGNSIEHVEWRVLFETDQFVREFSKDEKINVEGCNYKIQDVSHNENGSIFYYIDKLEIIEDQQSKKQAENDLGKRKLFLLERQLEELIKASEEEVMHPPIKNKKWWEFWINED